MPGLQVDLVLKPHQPAFRVTHHIPLRLHKVPSTNKFHVGVAVQRQFDVASSLPGTKRRRTGHMDPTRQLAAKATASASLLKDDLILGETETLGHRRPCRLRALR